MREVNKRMKKIIAIMFLYIMSFNIFSDGVILDPNSPYNTKIDRSSSGVPVINISTPNNSGISINNFLEYNVGKEGQILNNADNLGRSHLGGIINANPNLGPHQAANLIILQVNGANRSQIEGYIEALSRQRVNVILGNENGIYINGGGTVNIKNFIPTTGKINLKDGQFVGIDVEKGQIIVGLNGFDASRTDFVDLISKSVTLQGNVVGNEIKAVTGSNNVDKDGNIQKNGKGTPSSVAIDASSLGGMYANTVKIISTDKGAGVNSDAFIVSANSKLEVTADGKVKVKKVQGKGIEIKGSEYEQTDLSYSEGDINISAGTIKLSGTGTQSTGNINLTGNVENTSALYAKGTLITGMLKNSSDIQTGKNLDIFGDLKNSGHIRSLDNVNILGNLNNKGNIETNSNINVKNTVSSGTISGKNITTGKLDNNGSLNVNGNLTTEDILNKGNILVSGIMKSGNVSNEGKVLVNGTIQLLNTKTSGILAAGDNIAVKNIENGGEFATKQNIFVEGSFINTGKIEGNDISVKGTSLSNKGSIKGKNIFATVNDTKNEGEIHISENIAFVTENLTNTKEILAGNDISSNNVNLINTGKIASNGKINFNNSSISNKGEILSNTIEMQDVSKYENTGHIKGDTTTLTTVNDINLTGTLHGENNLTIKGNNIVNIGKTTGIGKISITSNDFTNNSELSSDSVTVTASGNVINNSMISGEKGTIKGKELYNNDLIAVNGDLEIEVQNKIVNSAGKVIYAGKSSILKGKEILNNRGDILGGNISLEASKVRNEVGTIQGTGNIDIKSSSFENIGEVTDINRYELYYETWDGKRLSEGELVNWERYDDPGVMKGKHSHNATGPQRQWLENYILNSERITGYKSYLLTSEPDTVSGVIGLQGDYTFASNTARFPVKALEGKLESRANTNYGRVTAGGNITINSSDVVNKDGFISAGNTADIKADRIENTVTTGNGVQLKDGRERIYLRFKRGSKEASANAVFARELVAGGTAYTSGQSSVIEGRSVIVDSTKIIPQSIPQANGEVRTTSSGGSGKAVNVMVNRGITGTNGKIHIVGNTATIADIKNTGTISVNPSFSNSLFIKNVNPSSMYIMETRGRYINLNGYLGSEYFLNKVAYKEDWSRVKRLGDAYYENQIISKALNEKLGTGFINGKSGQELVKNMMDGAETEAKAQGLKVGEALTAEQVKNLKKDIIWYVYTEVNGQKVLTPQVYLSRTTLAGLEEDSRSRIGGSEYTSLKTEDLVNKGMKIGNKGTTIVDVKTLKNETLTNQLSEISGDTTIVKSEGDIRNIGGKISGKDFVGLTSAKGDIVNETTKVTTVRNTGAYDRTKYEEVGSIGEIDGKKIYLSGKDYNSTGAILNTENLVLNLSGDINASSLELEGNDKLGTNSKNYSTFSSKENAGSAIVTKKVSGTVNNINLTGSAFIAEDGKGLSVKNVNVESAVNKYDEYRTASSSNTFTKKNSTMKSHTEENAASTFAIEKNAHISGTVKAIGSNVLLGQDSYVGGKVTTDSRELHNSYYQEDKKSGFSGSIGKGSITAGYGKNRNTYDEKSVINAKSNLQIGDGSVLNKGAEITATNFSHGQISINNGDVVYGARKDTRDVTTTSKSSRIGVSASVKSPALDRVRQAKDTANQIKSGDNIGGAVNIGNIVTGVISGLAGNQGNRQGRYDSRGSVGKEGVKSALANNNFYANIGINAGINTSKNETNSHTEHAVVTTITGLDGNSSITYNNVKNITYKGTHAEDTTMIYNNVENINKEAVELNNRYSSSGKSTGINAGATVGYGHKLQTTGNGGSISFNKSNMNTTETIHHNGSFLNVNEVHNNTKNMKLKGFNQEGGTVTGNIKNLELVSVQ
ncbi:filamentous hemagglutinin N-terminal domain-containing protein, partial [Leptotrichia sp. OH3620_COT-345]|uniref:two-partner secretion domain-containing protein n=2 Tax=Leptotrichia sp. OH3620_COT-345 TaxID=2491048 RepID=UPI000F64FDE3